MLGLSTTGEASRLTGEVVEVMLWTLEAVGQGPSILHGAVGPNWTRHRVTGTLGAEVPWNRSKGKLQHAGGNLTMQDGRFD